jgi:hypothetical protein
LAHPSTGPVTYPSGALAATHDSLRYHQFISIACHNCYEPRMRIRHLTAALAVTHDLELDIHADAGAKTEPGQVRWLVRHDEKTNDHVNNCLGRPHRRRIGLGWAPGQPSGDLRDCLRSVSAWMGEHSDAPVITLFLDLKDSLFVAPHTARALDALLQDELGERLYTPAAFARGTTVRAAAMANRWPRLDSLHGRVVVVLTGGEDERKLLKRIKARRFNPTNKMLHSYARARGDSAVAFVAPSIRSGYEILGKAPEKPGGRKTLRKAPLDFQDDMDRLAFYNLMSEESDFGEIGRAVRSTHSIVRLWLANEIRPRWGRFSRHSVVCEAARNGIQRVATKHFLKDRICPSASAALQQAPPVKAADVAEK